MKPKSYYENRNSRIRVFSTHIEYAVKNLTFLIDLKDENLLRSRSWWAKLSKNGKFYLYTSPLVSDVIHKNLPFHREVLNVTDGEEVDHINRNTLDNRRSNLRKATRSQNNINRVRVRPITKSPYRGVYPTPAGNWIARIQVSFFKRHLGTFKTAIEAANAYNEAAIHSSGEFAVLNEVH